MTDRNDQETLSTKEIHSFDLIITYGVEDGILVDAYPPLVRQEKSKLVLQAHKRIHTAGGKGLFLRLYSERGGRVDVWSEDLLYEAPIEYFSEETRKYSEALGLLHEAVDAFRLKTGDLEAMAQELIEVTDLGVQPLVAENFEFHHLPGLIRPRFATEEDGISSGKIAVMIDEAKYPPETFYFRDYFLGRLANKISLELVSAVENELASRSWELNKLIRLWNELSAVEVFYDPDLERKLKG